MRKLTTLAVAMMLAAAPLAAQQGHQAHHQGAQQGAMGMMGSMGAMQGGMMQGMMGGMGLMGMHGGPAMILRLAQPLGLSDAQVEQIQEIQTQAWETAQPQMQQAAEAARAASAVLEGDAPDMDAYQAHLREAADHGVQARVAMARAAASARAVLTAEQRSKLVTGMNMMSHMMQGGMMGQGMMGQGARGGMMGAMGGMPCMQGNGMMGGVAPDTTGG
jgi:Spy/CpxP family protein refolding chaperone